MRASSSNSITEQEKEEERKSQIGDTPKSMIVKNILPEIRHKSHGVIKKIDSTSLFESARSKKADNFNDRSGRASSRSLSSAKKPRITLHPNKRSPIAPFVSTLKRRPKLVDIEDTEKKIPEQQQPLEESDLQNIKLPSSVKITNPELGPEEESGEKEECCDEDHEEN